MIMPQTITRLIAGTFLGVFLSILLPGEAAASDNERYKAVPLGNNGASVLILDTRDGHLWTWLNSGSLSPDGKGGPPRIVYQGNIRQHMKTPAPQPPASGAPSSRF